MQFGDSFFVDSVLKPPPLQKEKKGKWKLLFMFGMDNQIWCIFITCFQNLSKVLDFYS